MPSDALRRREGRSQPSVTPTELKAIRKRLGLSTRALAEVLRISDQRTIRRWEAGDNPISGPASIVLALLGSGRVTIDEMDNLPP